MANPDLPEDVIMNILLRLPVKSLGQFRSVCKKWKTLISNPHFINSHICLTTAAADRNPAILIQCGSSGATFLVSSTTHPEHPINLTPPFPPSNRVALVGSSRGVLCFYNCRDNSVYFWNPCTRQFKHTPCWRSGTFLPGFGFDSRSSNYKFVKITNSIGERYITGRVYLYSVNADSWKEILIQEELQLFHFYSSALCFRGVLYWMSVPHRHLVLFDLHEEVFRMISFSSCWELDMDSCCPDVVIYRDSVALITYETYETTLDIDKTSLWTLDHGISASGEATWTKKFTFDANLKIERVLTYLSSGQFVLLNLNDEVFLYDMESEETKCVYGLDDPRDAYVFNYIESLVSIEGSIQVMT